MISGPEARDFEGDVVFMSGLEKRFGAFEAVRGVSMRLGRGQLLALLGPNGAGKTTTIRMLMGFLRPSAGQARILGLDCFTDRAAAMRGVGYMPDDPFFYDYLTGREIIRFAAEMRGLPPDGAGGRAFELSERLGLSEALDEYARNYSRGMKKKLAAILALLHRPELLILDEPTYGLDPHATRVLHELLREEAERGAGVFFSTHLLDQAEKNGTHAAILIRGRIRAMGPLDDLRRDLAGGGSLEDVYFSLAQGRFGLADRAVDLSEKPDPAGGAG